jgi:hypothetical protein
LQTLPEIDHADPLSFVDGTPQPHQRLQADAGQVQPRGLTA